MMIVVFKICTSDILGKSFFFFLQVLFRAWSMTEVGSTCIFQFPNTEILKYLVLCTPVYFFSFKYYSCKKRKKKKKSKKTVAGLLVLTSLAIRIPWCDPKLLSYMYFLVLVCL